MDPGGYDFTPGFAWTSPQGTVTAATPGALLDAGAAPALDFDALSVFLRIGFFVGDDTPFSKIRALPCPDRPAAGEGAAGSGVTRQQAVDGFVAAFHAAIARRLPATPYQLPLSGGRDSRHILLALVEAGRPPEACVTVEHFPPRGNDDIAVAAALCRRLGIRHIVLPQPADRVPVEREKNEATHFCTDEHAQFVVLARHLRQSTTETYDGIAGDVLSQSGYLTPAAHALFAGGDAMACARHVLATSGSVSEQALARLVSAPVLRQVPRERAVVRLAREIAPHLDAPNPVASFYFWNRTRREIALAPFGLLRGLTVHTPYLDRDLVGLLSGLPAALVMDRALHTEAIARAYPWMADIPYATAGVRRPGRWRQRRLAASLARLVVTSRGLLNRGSLTAGILATLVDGDPERLWHTPLTIYLAQLGELASLDR